MPGEGTKTSTLYEMSKSWVGVWVLLVGCHRAPAWLEEAPLIGVRVRDDAGREVYLVRPPQRVALATPDAVLLWQEAGLFSRVIAACQGAGEAARLFFLPCDDSLALAEALYKSHPAWVWVASTAAIPPTTAFPLYVFRPKGPVDWLRHLRTLGQVYDEPLLTHLADSLERDYRQTLQKVQALRRLRVVVLLPGEPLRFLSPTDPLSTLIEEAGGQLIPAESLATTLPEVVLLPADQPELVNDWLRLYPDAYNSPALRYKRLFSVERAVLERPLTQPIRAFYTLLRILHPEVSPSSPQPAEPIEQPTQDQAEQ